MGFVFKLHYALLSGATGSAIIGLLGVCAVVSVLSGLILWWPLTGRWRQALTFKWRSTSERFNYEIHKTGGFYISLVLLAVLLSGISMNLPEQFVWLVERFSTVEQTRQLTTQVDQRKRPVSVDEAWSVAQNVYTEGYLYWFSVPVTETGVFVFTQHGPLGAGFHGRRKIIVDRYGAVLHRYDSLHGKAGSVFMQWMWPLHSGQFYGMLGRLSVCLSGVVWLLLFVTGYIRWQQKRRAARVKNVRKIG